MILSVIIPVYNVEKYVEKCIRSCETQDISSNDFEIICVNDGSNDNSLQIIERLAKEFSNITIISQPNGGLSAARNTGMRYAHGDYYMFVDSDDWIAENCLGKLTKKLKDEQPDALAICAANVVNGVAHRRFSYLDEEPVKGKELFKRGFSPCAPFSIWSSLFFKKYDLRFYEGIFHEDSELTPRAYYLAEKVSKTNDIIYFVYQNPNSITRTINPKKSFDRVNVVCTHLSDFAKHINAKDRIVFYDMVGMYLNNAMHDILYCDSEQQNQFNKTVVEHRMIWNDLKKSSLRKYRIEAILFSLFSSKPLSVYKLITKFKI